MIYPFVLALVGLATSSGDFTSGRAALRDGVVKECQAASWDSATTQELPSLQAVPVPIRKALVDRLQSRVGRRFYERMTFHRALLVRPPATGRAADNSYYQVEFVFSRPEAGVRSYCASIYLDARGRLLNDIDLPDVASDEGRGVIVPVADALRTAQLEGVPLDSSIVELGYERSPGFIVWLVSYAEHKKDGDTSLLTLTINANTGRKVRWSTSDIRF